MLCEESIGVTEKDINKKKSFHGEFKGDDESDSVTVSHFICCRFIYIEREKQ